MEMVESEGITADEGRENSSVSSGLASRMESTLKSEVPRFLLRLLCEYAGVGDRSQCFSAPVNISSGGAEHQCPVPQR